MENSATQVDLANLLPKWPARATRRLARLARLQTMPAGRALFREGQQHDAIYLIASGAVALAMQVPGRGQVQMLTLGPGDLAGWSPLLSGGTMTATATVVEPGQAFVFAAEALREACQSDRQLGYELMRWLAQGLSERLLATRLQLLDLFADDHPHTAADPADES